MLRAPALLLGPAALALAAGCTGATAPPPEGPTYHADVAPILQEHCGSCHVQGGIAPFGLESHGQAKNTADAIVDATQAGRMPPFGARETPECQPTHGFRDDLRLSAAELETLAAWRDAGAPEGDPATAPPPVEPPSLELSRVDLTLAGQTPYVTSGDEDEFICFVIDPGFAQTTFVSGQQVVPGNPKVAHHALLFTDPLRESEALANGEGWYDCFGGPGLSAGSQNGPSPQLLLGWVPGAVAQEAAPGVAAVVEAGSLLVLQLHYHPAGATADPDTTSVQLKLETEAPAWELRTRLIGNFTGPLGGLGGLLPGPNDAAGPEFLIPANVAGHTETMEFDLPASVPELKVASVAGHMHYVGRDELLTVEHGDGSSECLLQIPAWDFNWQRGYQYDAAIEQLPTVRGGDKLFVRCTYDNTMANPFLPGALAEQGMTTPVDVPLGESTLEEMCLGAFGFLLPYVP